MLTELLEMETGDSMFKNVDLIPTYHHKNAEKEMRTPNNSNMK